MRRLMLLVTLCASSLAGCGVAPSAPEPVVRTVEIRVPIPVPCIDAVPARPAVNTLAEILALGNAAAAMALMEQHNLLLGYAGEMDGAVAGCR
ncbi:MAG: hypothetical protein JWR10_2804 [Rubritepida sp.]|nr:hypothetical protein [Rubritepida sp.]